MGKGLRLSCCSIVGEGSGRPGSPTASLGRSWRLYATRAIRPKGEDPRVTLGGGSTTQKVSLPKTVLACPSPPSSRRVKVASVQPLSKQGEDPIGEKSIGATGNFDVVLPRKYYA